MAKKEKHYFPFYYKKWLLKTKGMTAEQRGVYINLICYDYDLGGLPDDDNLLLSYAEYKGRNRALILQFIRANFTVELQGSARLLRNKTVVEISGQVAQITDRRREGAKKTNQIKEEKKYAERNDERTLSDTVSVRYIKENININTTTNVDYLQVLRENKTILETVGMNLKCSVEEADKLRETFIGVKQQAANKPDNVEWFYRWATGEGGKKALDNLRGQKQNPQTKKTEFFN